MVPATVQPLGACRRPPKLCDSEEQYHVADLKKDGQKQEDASETRAYTKGQVKSQTIHRASQSHQLTVGR
jgi:hypothetical protein